MVLNDSHELIMDLDWYPNHMLWYTGDELLLEPKKGRDVFNFLRILRGKCWSDSG